MKTPWFAAFVCIALTLSGCATNQAQPIETTQPTPGNTTSARDVRDAAQEASSTARDVRSAINDLKSIFR